MLDFLSDSPGSSLQQESSGPSAVDAIVLD